MTSFCLKNSKNGLRNLQICYFGTYSMGEGYPRNRVIIEGLRRNGVDVIECHEDFWNGTEEKLEGIKAGHAVLKTFYRLLLTYAKLIYKFKKVGYYDAIFIGYAGHIDIFLAKFLNLFRRKPIIFDAFLSLYDTAVMDRGIVSPNSYKAKVIRLVDRWSCRIADAVLLDTQAHIEYFIQEFHLPFKKFIAIPVGSSIAPPYSFPPPLWGRDRVGVTQKDRFEVLYFGSYIPLHGVDIILKAAKILQEEKDIVFTLIGEGQLLSEMKALASELCLKSINFIDRFIREKELMEHIKQTDICLGIFGQTDKASRVIPCKVYNCLAMGKPLITAMTPATEGILTHMDNAFLCRSGDPDDLAKAISRLKDDVILREKISRCGQEFFMKNFSNEAIGKMVLEVVERLSKVRVIGKMQ